MFNNKKQLLTTPPNDLNTEQAYLGALMLMPELIPSAGKLIEYSDFYLQAHGELHRIILNLAAAERLVDSVTILSEIEKTTVKHCNAKLYATCIDQCATPTEAPEYAKIILEKSKLRRLASIGQNLYIQACEKTATSKSLIFSTRIEVKQVQNYEPPKNRMASEVCAELYKQISTAHTRGAGLLGPSTGFPRLDNLLLGLIPDEVLCLASRAKHGKTALATQIGDELVRAGRRVFFYSLEMKSERLMARIVSQRTGIDGRLIIRGALKEYQWGRVSQEINRISQSGWIFCERTHQTPEQIENNVISEYESNPFDLLILDYLQLIEIDRRPKRYEALGAAAQTLLSVAKVLHIPVILISQLSREVERERRWPQLSDIRESGDIEQICAQIIFPFRPRLVGIKKHPKENYEFHESDAYFLVAANRFGPIGRIRSVFDGPTTKFREADFMKLTREQGEGEAVDPNDPGAADNGGNPNEEPF